ncbi:MAG: Wzz/FepE/Etk N-terminal domain-containing protein [Terriglobales bacterium]
MSENRELTMDDYLAMLRRRLKVILIPALLAPLAGYLVSYAPFFPPKYTATSTVLVEGQKVPENYVAPIITSDFAQRVQTLTEQIVNQKLGKMIVDNGLAKSGSPEEDKLISSIQQTIDVEPVITSMSAAAAPSAKKKSSANSEALPGFVIQYSDTDPVRAQKVSNALAQEFVSQNLQSRLTVADQTTQFLGDQVDAARSMVEDEDAKLAAFKSKHMGELPTDVDNNMRILLSLNSQLDATTQTLSRAQQDKAYTESMLAQQIAAWKTSQSSTNPQTLQQELTQLQGQLLQLQARYTDDHPDVIKTKADIAEVEKKLKEINAAEAAAGAADGSEKASSTEPPEIKQLRLQVHQYQELIEQATLDQKRLQSAISQKQSHTAIPSVEEEYRKLIRDNDDAQKTYQDLLAKKSSAELGTSMEKGIAEKSAPMGERMYVGATANLPEDPSFPNRPLFAAGGFGAGLAIGLLIAIWLEFSDKSIRTEKDAAVIMDLPLLISVPWLGEDDDHAADNGNGNGRRRFWGRRSPPSPKEHENVEV